MIQAKEMGYYDRFRTPHSNSVKLKKDNVVANSFAIVVIFFTIMTIIAIIVA